VKRDIVYEIASAVVSDCGVYRYRLGRDFRQLLLSKPSEKCLLWIMLNPSTADARTDDPTIRKCRGFAERLGFGWFLVGNLFAYRATDPKDLLAAERSGTDVVGPENDDHLRHMIANSDAVLCAWGAVGKRFPERCRDVVAMIPAMKRGHLGDLSKGGCPKHPLMLGYDTPVVWEGV